MKNNTEDTLILIPARGGSTRIKDKNIKMFGEEPLIARIIKTALESNCGRVVVTTDSERIKEVALKYGAEVPFLRPAEFATTEATSLTPILHAIQWFKENENWEPKYIIDTVATKPFTSVQTIRENKQKLIDAKEHINSCTTVCTPNTHPFSIVMLNEENSEVKDGLVYVDGKNNANVVRSQEYPKVYEMVSNCITTKTRFYNKLLKDANGDISKVDFIRTLDDKNCIATVVNQIESIDIDEPEDFEFALKIAGYLKEEKNKH